MEFTQISVPTVSTLLLRVPGAREETWIQQHEYLLLMQCSPEVPSLFKL